MSKKICSVIFQTHWDREWYLSFETFRARLIRVMERIVTALDSQEIETFLFDGQVIAAEDLLEACEPELAQKVRQYMQQGKLVLGPWYVMADEFLCSGESLIRNLEIGRKLAHDLGNYQQVGYLPDTFGHIGQMPQILSGFNINNAVLWRGIDQQQSELRWRATDGTEIFLLFLSEGYYQHPLNTKDFTENVLVYLDKITERATSDHLLLTQGGDHLRPAADNMAQRIAEFNQTNDKFELKQSNLADYIQDIQARSDGKEILEQGELRGNEKSFVLPDVISTRRYLKQRNQQAEDKLTQQVEPLLAMAPLSSYPQRYLEQNWKTLLSQHAHDSICGCSIDEVHREMMTRYEKLEQRNQALIDQALLSLGCISDEMSTGDVSPFADHTRFTLFNSQIKPYQGWVSEWIFLAGEEAKGLMITDQNSHTFEPVISEIKPGFSFHSPIDDFPDKIEGTWYQIHFAAQIPALTAQAFKVEKQQTRTPMVTSGAQAISNEFYSIEVKPDATLTITELATGQQYTGMARIESSLDCGDSYSYSAPLNDKVSVAKLSGDIQVRQHADHSELSYPLELTQPQSLDHDRRGASDHNVVSCGTMIVKLFKQTDRIECHLNWDNQAKDHRLSLHLPTNEKLHATYADSAFEVAKRGIVYQDNTPVLPNKEAKVSVFPSQSFISAGKVQLNHLGMNEYRVVEKQDDELAATLLRCVGWLSRRDFTTRGNGAGPDLPTPEAQCLGQHNYQFELVISEFDAAQACNRAKDMRQPPMLIRGVSNQWATAVATSNMSLQCSSLRQVDDQLEIRLWNPTDQVQSINLSCPYQVVNFIGESQPMVDDIQPNQIITLRITR